MTSMVDEEVELDRVILWRLQWLRAAGWSRRNAQLIASDTKVDWRFANDLLKNCKEKGYDEDFAMKLLF